MGQSQRHIGQKIAFAFAICAYLAAIGCVFAIQIMEFEAGQDPIKASLMASVVFFIGCGVVLHVIGKANLKGLLSGSGDLE